MKKYLALCLSLCMVFTLLAGCGKTETPATPSTPADTTTQTPETPAEPEVPAEPEAPTEPVETVPPVLMGTVNADNLNVRSEPYSTADILKRLAINTRVEILEQKIVDGIQVELPDVWLPGGEVWLVPRTDRIYHVKMGGHVKENWKDGHLEILYEDCEEIEAVPYDMMISGSDSKAVSQLRLWKARECILMQQVNL